MVHFRLRAQLVVTCWLVFLFVCSEFVHLALYCQETVSKMYNEAESAIIPAHASENEPHDSVKLHMQAKMSHKERGIYLREKRSHHLSGIACSANKGSSNS